MMTDASGITFLRSTTTTTVNREAEGDTKTRVTHIAQFSIKLGTIPDMEGKYSTRVFRPAQLEVEWRNGYLNKVIVSGPRSLKGGLSAHQTGNYPWRSPYRVGNDHPLFNRAELPDAIAARIAEYEADISAEHLSGLVKASHTGFPGSS